MITKKFKKSILVLYSVILVIGSRNDLQAQNNTSNPLPHFLFPSFTKGIVKMKNGTAFTALLDYNMIDENMVFKQQDNYMVLDKPEDIDTIYLQERKLVPVKKAFYEVVVKGRVTIFIEHKSTLAPVGTTTAYGITSKTLGVTAMWSMQIGNQVRNIDLPDNVTVTAQPVYWAKVNDQMYKFTNEKQLLKIFPESEKEIKEFIKSSRIEIKTREGLSALGNYLNSRK